MAHETDHKREGWLQLGRQLERWLSEAEERLVGQWREHLETLVWMGGATDEEHPLLLAARTLTPDLEEGELIMRAQMGGMGAELRDCADRVNALRAIRDIWEALQEECEAEEEEEEEQEENEDFDAPWESFWTDVADGLRQPPEVERVLVDLPGLAREARAAAKDPICLWPLELLGVSEQEILAETLDQVAERTGLPRETLPASSIGADTPAMSLVDSARACLEVRDWLTSREAWVRVIGQLLPLLRELHPCWSRPQKA